MTSPHRSNRRQFLKTTAAAGIASATGPLILKAQDKSGSKLPVVGSGEYTFECHHDWGMDTLPAGFNYGQASHGVAVDSEGLVYVTHHGEPASIFVFDQSGRFVRAMGKLHTAMDRRQRKSRGYGHGIDIRKEGSEEFIYLAPNESSLPFAKVTLSGELVWKKNRTSLNEDSGVYENPKTRYRPTNTSFRPDGGYYLGDGYGSFRLFEYDAHDKFVRAIGGPGSEDGRFKTPHGQWLDTRDGTPRLVVCDRANARLQWFNMDGTHHRTQDDFLFPADIDVQGRLMVVPDLHARVTLLDESNTVVAHLGDDPSWREKVLAKKFAMRSDRAKWRPGRFVHPHDACFDAEGNIFVAEWVVTGRLTKLVRV